ncbi:hypothetical protein AKJ40_00745 [candidate division MSBL1 archaeon SCGC-AAA259M10]|uniref:Uncharacterized protein n=1 Tax=candidate division MSBL1 archaeon SCGC-AAA259M10 TaxID=1698270 RepID=A0A133V2R9_9EURY|nr:hypothetical protein AKJ40_00745 [candidate division MSBL1 archaeon SCGC-AAA259M10]
MPEKTYQDLKDEFDKKVEKLREECDHLEVSDWRKECWAIGHTTGFEVKVCEICRETVAKRTSCANCGKLIEEEDFEEGNGTRRPSSEIFCPECQEEWEKFIQEHPYRPESEESVKVVKHLSGGGTEETERELKEGDHYMRLHRKFLEREADV